MTNYLFFKMLARNTKVVTFVFETEPKIRIIIIALIGFFLEPIANLRRAIVISSLQPVRIKA